jgi:hypothetical protein
VGSFVAVGAAGGVGVAAGTSSLQDKDTIRIRTRMMNLLRFCIFALLLTAMHSALWIGVHYKLIVGQEGKLSRWLKIHICSLYNFLKKFLALSSSYCLFSDSLYNDFVN